MRHVHFLTLPGACILLASCSPVINTVYLAGQKFSPRPTDHPIQLYTEKLPECEFQELAIVIGTTSFGNRMLDDVTEALRETTRQMGGDAVIHLKIGPTSQAIVSGDSASISISTASSIPYELNGTVIRFLQEDCRK